MIYLASVIIITEDWKPFRNALSKSERKKFDEMWDIPRLYVSACSNSCQLIPLQPIIISILFHHYKDLKECILEVEQMMIVRVQGLEKGKEEQEIVLSIRAVTTNRHTKVFPPSCDAEKSRIILEALNNSRR